MPDDFRPPTSLVTDRFRLEPLEPGHNAADHAAWTSSIAHIRATPGFIDSPWQPLSGGTAEQNLVGVRRHVADFADRTGFTFTFSAPDDAVVGCVHLYPSNSPDHDVKVRPG